MGFGSDNFFFATEIVNANEIPNKAATCLKFHPPERQKTQTPVRKTLKIYKNADADIVKPFLCNFLQEQNKRRDSLKFN